MPQFVDEINGRDHPGGKLPATRGSTDAVIMLEDVRKGRHHRRMTWVQGNCQRWQDRATLALLQAETRRNDKK